MEAPAKPVGLPAPPIRARHTGSRLVQYLLLQALIAVLCIFVLVRPLPEPPSNYVVTGFQLSDRGEGGPAGLAGTSITA